MNFDYLQILRLAAPETILVLAALGVLALDLTGGRGKPLSARMETGARLTIGGCLAALGWMFAFPADGGLADGMFVASPLTQWLKSVLLVLTIGTTLVSMTARFTGHVGEYFALILFATTGMLFIVSSENLLMVFLALELTSLSLYVLVAFNKAGITSAEAALKYFLFGGMSAAFMLFGLSLIYGASGQIEITAIRVAIAGRTADSLLLTGLVMTLVGLGFKVAIVPFHLWAPDAYQGAPTPSAALIASGSKVAGFFILARLLSVSFPDAAGSGDWRGFLPGWMPVLAVCGALSMILGNLAAIRQTSVKRLLGYSAVAHSGYMVLGVMVAGSGWRNEESLAPLLYYVTTYALTSVGAFAVVSLVERETGNDQITSFAGLSRRAPVASFAMLIFLLSLAGIPPLAGFFGKFYLFAAAADSGGRPLGWLWLVILAIATSAVSLYYYLQVLKQIFVIHPPEDAPDTKLPLPASLALVVVGASVATLVLGCAPRLWLGPIQAALQARAF